MSLANKMHETAMTQQESKFWDQYNRILKLIQHEADNGNTHLIVDDVTYEYKYYFFGLLDTYVWTGMTARFVDQLTKDGFKTRAYYGKSIHSLKVEW